MASDPLPEADGRACSLRIGALVPLTRPGWVDAGRHLLAGLEVGVREVNDAGGVGGQPLALEIRDTAGDPDAAAAAMDELAGMGLAAVVGEYHSVAARAAAARADALELPFLCSSAVLDALTERPAKWVARLAPRQSRGWSVYADFLHAAGHTRIAVVAQGGAYWAAGTKILRQQLVARGGAVVELATDPGNPGAVCGALLDSGATALLLLVGHPEPALTLVRAVRRDARLAGVVIGAPAGQPELPGWATSLGSDGAAIPFLRYLPERLSPTGELVASALHARLACAPSFVAFEGYDTITVLVRMLRSQGADRERLARYWPHVTAGGSRGQLGFSRSPDSTVWEWAGAPVQVAQRDAADITRYETLYSEPPLAGRPG